VTLSIIARGERVLGLASQGSPSTLRKNHRLAISES
jgi:hypothetical protein